MTIARRSLFGVAGIRYTRDKELDAESFDIEGEIGWDPMARRQRGITLCPTIAIARGWATTNPPAVKGLSYNLQGSVGLDAGGVVVTTRSTTILSSVGLRASRIEEAHVPGPEARQSLVELWIRTRTYYEVFARATAVRRRFVFSPFLSIPFSVSNPKDFNEFSVPFGRKDRELSAGVALAVMLGTGSR